MNGTLFLSGGGDERASHNLDERLVRALLPTNKHLLYIPIALNRTARGFEEAYDWITKTLSAHVDDFIEVTPWLDVYGKTDEDLYAFDAIYIGGGNTHKLLSLFVQSGFDECIKHFLAQGKIIYGGSAGAIIFGNTIRTVSEENVGQYSFEDGLSLLGKYSLRCHFTKNQRVKMQQLAQSLHTDILALPEGTGLILNKDTLSALGEGIMHFDANGKAVDVQHETTLHIT